MCFSSGGIPHCVTITTKTDIKTIIFICYTSTLPLQIPDPSPSFPLPLWGWSVGESQAAALVFQKLGLVDRPLSSGQTGVSGWDLPESQRPGSLTITSTFKHDEPLPLLWLTIASGAGAWK